jgi:hypothetical protein
MKILRQLCAGLILTFALSASAFAGQVDCPGITDSQPQATGEMPQPAAAGEMQNDITDLLLIMLALV